MRGYDVGAAFLIGVPVGALIVRDRLSQVRLRNSAALSVVALLVGLVSVRDWKRRKR